ncbi:MAG TPA: alpha/beta hydrolase [Micromonosporaceae bacterium]|jgi:pimeloyl-ACP methyl ester carboxylesterase
MPTLNRPDGRTLAYEILGDPGDPVVFSIHGTPGSRLGMHPTVDGACVVAFDRPGYGDSDPQPGRDVAAVVGEVEALADALGAETFAVYGTSGGGPHALACAALLGERVTRVASLVGVAPSDALGEEWTTGMSPSNIEEFAAAAAGRDALSELLTPAGDEARANPAALADMLAEELPPPDVACLSDPRTRDSLVVCMSEGLRRSVDGWIDDDLAFCTAWGFDPATIVVPTLIWHGEDDVLVPVAHAHWLHRAIPGSRLVTVPNAGHLAALGIAPTVVGWLAGGPAL